MELRGRVAVMTGAAPGIGLTPSERCAAEGMAAVAVTRAGARQRHADLEAGGNPSDASLVRAAP